MDKIVLQTAVPVEAGGVSLNHADAVMLLGSCFADNMGERFEAAAFDVFHNPFGVLYNPMSIALCLRHCLDNREITTDDLVYQQSLWHSWLHHSSFSATTPEECLLQCNTAIHRGHEFLSRCSTIVITLGTAFVYKQKGTGRVVGNCHKVPQQQFIKTMATVEEIVSEWQHLIFGMPSHIKQIVFTVSPIRHWADGAHGNQLSKATLLMAVERLLGRRAGHTISYFPAYEIMIDELRDYRYYADDLLHPNALAEKIIWQRFAQTYMSEATLQIVDKAEQLYRMSQHRPFFPDSEEYKKHKDKTEQLRHELQRLLSQK